MKTVIDAVNEFKGVYFDGECGEEEHQNQVVYALRDFGGYRLGDIHIGSGNTNNNTYWKVICSRNEFNQCVEEMSKAEWIKPVTLPTFTQTMADAGELPSVDMECLYKERGGINWCKCKIIAIHEKKVWLSNIDSGSSPLNNITTLEFKPLTPPIELIDGKCYQFYYGGTKQGFYVAAAEEMVFIGGSLRLKKITNIQPLTVEVK